MPIRKLILPKDFRKRKKYELICSRCHKVLETFKGRYDFMKAVKFIKQYGIKVSCSCTT